MRQLFITDLDGTLLRDDATLSEYSRNQLMKLLDAGVLITVATGRSLASVRQLFEGIPLRLPLVCGNGAYIAWLDKDDHWHTQSIPKPVDHEVMDLIDEFQLQAFLSTYTGSESRLYMPRYRSPGIQWYWEERSQFRDPRLRELDDIRLSLREQVLSVNVISHFGVVRELQQSISGHYQSQLELYTYDNLHNPDWLWLSVHDIQATKANAIRRMQQLYNLEDYELTLFGDNYNDLSMFHMQAKKIAVANAKPEIIALADEVIGSNETDSVIDYIAKSTIR